MKKQIIIGVLLLIAVRVPGGDVENPVEYLANRPDLTVEEQQRLADVGFKQISYDLNGDSVQDLLLCHDDPESDDAIEKRERAEFEGLLPWDVFIKSPTNGTYRQSIGLALENEVEVGLSETPMINPDLVFIGEITEISRYGIVCAQTDAHGDGEPMTTIWAYTWEGAHMKRHKLVDFETAAGHAIFNKYLAEDKRTQVQVTQVTP
jgi:hypothetical protein